MKQKYLAATIGGLVFIGSIWGGAYGMRACADWANFPCFATAFVTAIAGVVICVVSLGKNYDC